MGNGNSYMALQTSKDQTKMTRFLLEGPWLHNDLFCVHRQCACFFLTNLFVWVGSSLKCKTLIVFCAWLRPNKEQKHTRKNFVRFDNHRPPLTACMVIEQLKQPGCENNALFRLRQIQTHDLWDNISVCEGISRNLTFVVFF